MGQRGPKPKPAEMLRLMGSHHQYDRRDEVAIVEGEPTKPQWLGRRASEMWDRSVTRLRNQGILSAAWQESLTALCERWERYESLAIQCRRLADDDPLWKQCREAFDDFVKIAREFGLTPAAKTGVRKGEGLPANRKGYIKRA